MINFFPLFILFFCSDVHATADGPDFWDIHHTQPVQLYEKVDPTSAVLDTIPEKTVNLKSLGCTGVPSFSIWEKMTEVERKNVNHNQWCKVEYKGKRGWVELRYLKEHAVSPSFNCKRAIYRVEELICQDKELIKLDRTLQLAYQQASKTKGLKVTQRRWTKQRNQCWKAQDMRECVQNNYEARINELQVIFAKNFADARFD